jgi:hypothetical protein
MVNRDLLIGKVSPFMGKKEILVANQDTVDIIDALISNHYKYSKEYDKIFSYFDGGNVEETAFNVWQFLKDQFKYTIEPEKMQILRSPAAIFASNMVGIDCKGYATFANGIMDAYRRKTGKNFDVYYRFASYDPYDKIPQHVFAVVKEKGVEYWIDPVLDQFDEKKQPYYYKDKKIKNMALVAMSGISNKMGDMAMDLSSNDGTFDTSMFDTTNDPSLPQNDFSYYADQTSTGDQYLNQDGGLTYSGGQYYDQSGNIVDQSGDLPTNVTAPTPSSTATSWFDSLLKSAPGILTALNPNSGVVRSQTNIAPNAINPMNKQVAPKTTGISTNTIFLIGAAGLAIYFLTKKK